MLGRRKGRVHEHFRRFASGRLRRCRPARRHADLDLHRQPVPAQFDRRDRAQPGGGARPLSGRDRASVQRVLPGVRRRADSVGHGARPLRPVALPDGVGGDHGGRHGRVRPRVLIFGRALLGMGTAGSLVASLAIYAQRFPPERFATLTGLQVGIGTLGTLLATAPLAMSTAAIGWRASFLAVGAFTLVVAALIAAVVPDDARPRGRQETLSESLSGILAVMRTPSMGRLFVMNLAAYSTFGLVVGLWGGPYLTHIYGYGLEERGVFLLVAVLTQIVGSMLWGPMDRVAGNHKLPVLLGAGTSAAALGALALVGALGPSMLMLWSAALGFVAAYVALLIPHGRVLFPLHLVGRGLTVLNMASMGGTFLVQAVSGFVIELFPAASDGPYALAAYRLVFALQAGFILLACLVYFGSREPIQGRPEERGCGLSA